MILATLTSEVFAVNVNWNANDGDWNVNAYRLDDNDWNAGNRAFPCNCGDSLPSYFGRVLLSMPRFHPPSILPTSSSCSDSIV